MSDIPPLVRALLDPQAYPHPPGKVELIQTQISYVFIADEFVYKIKKPDNFGFLDYSTLDKRLALCVKEVELNQRLCRNIYLGIVPVTKEDGRIVMDGIGEILEYAVMMRCLPPERMMDALLPPNRVTLNMLAELAGVLVDFHARAATGEQINEMGSPEIIAYTIEDTFNPARLHVGELISSEAYHRITDYERRFLDNNRSLFLKRIADGRIRDCHGDLHANHVCFGDEIYIYDCIEFSDRLRFIDVAAEIAFLAMDLDRFGRRDLSKFFVDIYVEKSGDTGLLELLDFYKIYRAGVRYMVNCQQYDDPLITPDRKEAIVAAARQYAELAESYVSGT